MDDQTTGDQSIIAQLNMLLDSQPPGLRNIFHFCLCQMMVEVGKMELVSTSPGENGRLCHFRLVNEEETFVVPDLNLPANVMSDIQFALREILKKETNLLD
jgi:hypothetical protein